MEKDNYFLGENIKKEFPVLNKGDVIYLDNAATTQKPRKVIDSINEFYNIYNSNVHRGAHNLSEKASEEFEIARDKVASYLSVSNKELIFTYGTTFGINMLAFGLKDIVNKGDNIVITEMEHHSNIVPWQEISKEKGTEIRVIPVDDNGRLNIDKIDEIVDKSTKIFSFSHTSNVLGTRNDVESIIRRVKKINKDCICIVDGAQEVSKGEIDCRSLGCDAYVFSSHKMFGPTGVGAVYISSSLQKLLKPFVYGGGMISDVDFDRSEFSKDFRRFEAGTPHISGVIGFGKAVDFLKEIDNREIEKYEGELVDYFLSKVDSFGDKFELLGPRDSYNRSPIFSFNIKGISSYDVALFLNSYNIATRSGHHCAIPLHKRFGVDGSIRASFSIYNTKKDIDLLFEALNNIERIFSK